MAKLTINDVFNRNCQVKYTYYDSHGCFIPGIIGYISMSETLNKHLSEEIEITQIIIKNWSKVLEYLIQENLINNEGKILIK